jgi:hypothetical protein
MEKSKPNNYVDNKAFLEAFKRYLPVALPLKAQWKKECEALLKQGVKKSDLPPFERPKTPDYEYIGECLLKIAQHLQYHPWYAGYTFREEMVGDALENAIRYLENFDTEKYDNPFAYFTQVMRYAFQRRKTFEKNQEKIKRKSLENTMDFFTTQELDSGKYKNSYVEFVRKLKNDDDDVEEEKEVLKKEIVKTRKRTKGPGIEKFLVPVEETNEVCPS